MEHERKQRGAGKTVERLLDAAERLFGEHGYDGVGMRMLAHEAHVNLAAATYHFGSKRALYVETFLRRIRAVNSEQTRLLSQLERDSTAGLPQLERVVEALVRPSFLAGLEHPAFNRMLARTMIAPPRFLHAVLRREIEPNNRRSIEALHRALPQLPVEVLQLRMALVLGSLLMLAVRVAARPRRRDAVREAMILKELVRFTSRGLMSEPATADAELTPLRVMQPTRRSAASSSAS